MTDTKQLNRTRVWTAIAALFSAAFMGGVFSSFEFMGLHVFPDWETKVDSGDIGAFIFAIGIVWGGLMTVLTNVFAAVAFLVWLHRATKLGHALGGFPPDATPAAAVGCWFIPFVNLVRPYRVVRSVYRSSQSDASAGVEGDWLSRRPWIFPWWWGTWLVSSLLGNASFRVSMSDAADAERISMWLDLIDTPFSVVAALAGAAILWSIQVRQEAQARALPPVPVPAGPPLFVPSGQGMP